MAIATRLFLLPLPYCPIHPPVTAALTPQRLFCAREITGRAAAPSGRMPKKERCEVIRDTNFTPLGNSLVQLITNSRASTFLSAKADNMNIGQSFAHILSRRLEAVEGNGPPSYRRALLIVHFSALFSRRLEAVEGNGPPSYRSALLRKISSYRSSQSPATLIYIRNPKQLVLPPYFEKAIPYTQKTVPHAGILT